MKILLRSLVLLLCLMGGRVMGQAPVANFTVTPASGCGPLLVQLTSTSTGTITSYSWDLGNNNTSVLQNPSTTYLTPGTYTVTLTVTGPGGSNTKTLTNIITVLPQPSVVFNTPDTAGCPPLSVQFTNSSVGNVPGAMIYAWDFGDGNTSTLATPSHVYALPGYYSPTLVVTNSAGCSNTLVMPALVHVYTPPGSSIGAANTVYCHAPANVTFTSYTTGSPPFTSAWTFGDGGTGTGSPTSHTYLTPGVYNVGEIVTDVHGCKDTVMDNSFITVHQGASFTGPASGCVQSNIFFSNTSGGVVSSQWLFGDGGSSSNSDTVTHNYNTAGTYTVTLITDLGGCLDTVTHTIVINPLPTATITPTPFAPCDIPAPVQFTGTGTGISNWAWDFGDGGVGSGPNPLHTYTQYGPITNYYGSTTITATITSSAGCVSTVSTFIYLMDHKLYLKDTTAEPGGCAPFTVQFSPGLKSNRAPSPTYTYPYPPTSYTWNFGDGSPISTVDSPLHVYTTPGTYTAILTVTTGNGCTYTDSLHIHVGTPPTASFYAYPLTACVKVPINFISTTTNTISNPGTYYFWDFGDNTAQAYSTGAITHEYQYPGTYTIILHAFNNGCEDTAMITNYITINPPNAFFFDSLICPVSHLTIGLKNISMGATSQLWKFGDGTTSTSASPGTHTFPSYGSYTTQLITYNSTYGCTDTFNIPISIQPPVFNFTATDTTVCLEDTVHLAVTPGVPYSTYQWAFGNTLSPLPDTLTHYNVYGQPRGYYSVRLIIRDNFSCFDTLIKPNYVLISRPFTGFTGSPVIGCTPLNVTFTDTSNYTPGAGYMSNSWSFGDGGTATSATTIAHSYVTAGVYTVTLVSTDSSGCEDSVSKNNYVDARHPTAAFASTTSAPCIGQLVSFTNNTSGAGTLSYTWAFGDGGTSTLGSPTHTYSAVGTYPVRLIVTDEVGCKDTTFGVSSLSVTRPSASFTLSDTIAVCPPLIVHFTNTSANAAAYTWDLGNGGTSTLTNPVNTYSAPGTYNIRMIATNVNGCSDTAYAHVRVLGYAGALTYTPLAGCKPLLVHFTASVVNVPSLIWDFSDGVTAAATGATYNHTYLTPGAYVPKLIFSDNNGCVNSSVGLDTIKVDGVRAGFKILPPCVNTPVSFTDTSSSYFSAVVAQNWNFGGGISAGGTPAVHIFAAPGTYPVTLIATNANGCSDTITRSVVIYALPDIKATGDTTVCPDNPAPLSASGGVSYTWAPGATLSCTACNNTIATTPNPITYTVTGTDANGCINTDTVHVGIQFRTTSDAGPGGDICQRQSFQLSATGADVYQWYPATTLDNSNIANPVATPSVTTNYMVVATEGDCPPDTNYVRVVVNLRPVIQLQAEETIVAGGSVQLQASGQGIGQYLWLPDTSTLSCSTCSSPIARPKKTTTYTVTASNQWGCRDTASVTVHVLCNNAQVFIPNTFTPNGDGQNDYFYPRGSGIDKVTNFRVYNRWGEVIYQKAGIDINDEKSGWDGTYKGKPLPPDVYVYVVDAICDNGEPVTWKGDVTLMR